MKKLLIYFAFALVIIQASTHLVSASTPPLPDSYLLTKTTFNSSTFPKGVTIQNDSLTGRMLVNESATPLYLVRALTKNEGIGGIPAEYTGVIKLVSGQIYWSCTYYVKTNTDEGCKIVSGKGLNISEEDFSLYQFQEGPMQTRAYVRPENIVVPPPQPMFIGAYYGGKQVAIAGSVTYSLNDAFVENKDWAPRESSIPLTSTQMGILKITIIIIVIVCVALLFRKVLKRKN